MFLKGELKVINVTNVRTILIITDILIFAVLELWHQQRTQYVVGIYITPLP